MDLLKISDFCRKYKLPPHRFTRYKRMFHTQQVDGYIKPWVKVDDWNLALVADILQHRGTRRFKDRLTLEEFCKRHKLTDQHFKKVFHRMNLENHNGTMMLVDTKHNYALLKHGRLYRTKN
jgi:hypothetical protein